jgi:superfamily II DNA or RNA helicase
MRLRIDNRIRVTGATPEQEAALKAMCEHENPRRADLPRLEAMLESRRWDGRLRAQVMAAREEPKILRTWRVEDGELTLPRGVWSKPPLGGLSAVEDNRTNGVALEGHPLQWSPNPKKTPRDYQRSALTRMFEEEQGLLRQSAGSGKTHVLLTFAVNSGAPTIVIVPSQALLEQWVAVAIQDFGLEPEDIGCIGGGTKKIRPLTIALVDSLAANDCKLAKELSLTFGCLLFDEVYGAPARTRYDVVDFFAARYRFGAGDDERRKDDVECLTYDLFGEVLAEAPRAMLEKLGWIHSVRVRLVETGTPPPKWWRDLPPLARATRYLEIVRYLEDDPKRAALVAALACREVRGGSQVLVFGHHRDHALRMQADVAAMAPDLARHTGRFLGGTSAAKERQDTTVGLLEGRTKAAFATYKALGKGINLPAVSRAVLATPIHGARENVNQVLARLNRTAEGKDRPEAAVLYDSEVFGLAPVRKFMAGKRDVVVQTVDGRELPARDYIDEWEAKADAEKTRPGSFFAGLSGADTGELRKGWR